MREEDQPGPTDVHREYDHPKDPPSTEKLRQRNRVARYAREGRLDSELGRLEEIARR